MRRLLLLSLLSLAVPTAARAADPVGAPLTHGPDRRAVGSGPALPPPAGGPHGKVPRPGQKLTAETVRKMLPSQWCGVERTTDDAANQLDNGPYRYHAVYMLPADGRDRFTELATRIQTDALGASALLERLYGRAIRYDLGTSCGSQYLDITVVRMAQTTRQLRSLANTDDGTFSAVARALDAAGFKTIEGDQSLDTAASLDTNYAVWLDGPAPSDSCGQATIYDDPSRSPSNLNNLGGKVATVFADDHGQFCGANAIRHEIGHNLGALQKVAPHAFDGMHCNDAFEDTMCYSNSPQRANGQQGLYFDYGNDDYWDPPGGKPLPWWTVNLNRFLCPNAACNLAPGPDPAPPASPAPVPAQPQAPCARRAVRVHRARPAACGKPAIQLALRAKRRAGGVWQVTLRARGSGSAVLALRCRVHRGGQVRTVLAREARLPKRLRARVRCRTAPRALAFSR